MPGWSSTVVDKAAQTTSLRRITPADRPLLRKWLRDPVIKAAIEDEMVDLSRISDTLALFESSDPFEDGGLGLLVERAGRPIGLIHFIWINWTSRNAEVIVLVGPSESRRSIAAAAVLEKVGHAAFRVLNLHKIYAFVYESNAAAVAIFRRIMQEEARLCAYVESPEGYEDVYFFGLLASEYHAKMRRYKGRY